MATPYDLLIVGGAERRHYRAVRRPTAFRPGQQVVEDIALCAGSSSAIAAASAARMGYGCSLPAVSVLTSLGAI